MLGAQQGHHRGQETGAEGRDYWTCTGAETLSGPSLAQRTGGKASASPCTLVEEAVSTCWAGQGGGWPGEGGIGWGWADQAQEGCRIGDAGTHCILSPFPSLIC